VFTVAVLRALLTGHSNQPAFVLPYGASAPRTPAARCCHCCGECSHSLGQKILRVTCVLPREGEALALTLTLICLHRVTTVRRHLFLGV
jgi:hypothetical protein